MHPNDRQPDWRRRRRLRLVGQRQPDAPRVLRAETVERKGRQQTDDAARRELATSAFYGSWWQLP
jgi:hypothetical protein